MISEDVILKLLFNFITTVYFTILIATKYDYKLLICIKYDFSYFLSMKSENEVQSKKMFHATA